MKESRYNYSELLSEHDSLRTQLAEAQAQIAALSLENQALKKRLSTFAKPAPITPAPEAPETPEATQVCPNCLQPIPSPNFSMHSLRCERISKRCPICQELVPASEFSAHRDGLKLDVESLFTDAESGDVQSVERRLQHGASISEESRDGMKNSLLHAAAKAGSVEMMELLVGKGGKVNAQNVYGETPLHLSVDKSSRSPGLVSFLLSQGADPQLQNALGDSPYALAMRQADHSLMLTFAQFADRARSSPMNKPRTASARSRLKANQG